MNYENTLLDRVLAIISLNKEIITRIQERKQNTDTTKTIKYQILLKETGLEMTEYPQDKTATDIVSEWKKSINLVQPEDFFNNKIKYECNTFDDIARINQSFSEALPNFKYVFPEKSNPILEIYKSNLEILQVSLGEIEEYLQHAQSKSQYHNILKEVNDKLALLLNNFDVGKSIGKGTPAIEWWDRTDNLGGIRQSTHKPNVYFLVSKSNVWDRSKVYLPPPGYRFMSTAEAEQAFQGNNSGNYVYYGQGGWSGYNWNGVERHCFLFSDSGVTNKYKHAGNYDPVQPQSSITENLFAGFVCIKE